MKCMFTVSNGETVTVANSDVAWKGHLRSIEDRVREAYSGCIPGSIDIEIVEFKQGVAIL